jgi:small subunit ribosomal protein S20
MGYKQLIFTQMANHKSSLKRIRSNEKIRVHNRYYSKTMRNAIKSFRLLNDKKEATEKLPGLVSLIDKLAKKSIIHKNKAANLKSKLTRKVNAL